MQNVTKTPATAMTQEMFNELCDRVGLDPLRVGYTQTLRAVFSEKPALYTCCDFELLILAKSKHGIATFTYYSLTAPHLMKAAYQCKIPLSLPKQRSEDFYYCWSETYVVQN